MPVQDRRRRRRRGCSVIDVQRLEDRSLLAGNVSAVFHGGSLVLTGDAQDNAVDVVVINGDLVVRGRDNTTINGADTPLTIALGNSTIRDHLFARLGRGNDDLFVEDASIGGSAVVDTHRGNDQVGFRNTTIGQNLVARTSWGDDGLSLDGVVVNGDLVVRTGRQSDVVRVSNTTIGRNTSIGTGIHDDSVVFDQSTFGGQVWVDTSAGHDNLISTDTTINGSLHAPMWKGHDFVFMDGTTVRQTAVIHTHGGADNLIFEGSNQFRDLIIDTGRGGDNVEVAAETTVARRRVISRAETGTVTAGVREFRRDDERLGGIARSNVLGDFFRSLSTTQQPLSLNVDVSSNGTIQSNDTLVTNDSNFDLQITTAPGATVAVDTDADGQFDDGTATADNTGNATLNVTLLHNDTNNGANTLNVQASNGIDTPLTEQLDVHLAVGTVVRFDSSIGTWDVELFDADTPNTVGAFLDDLSRYDNSVVHRNVDDFIVQGGGFAVDNSATVTEIPDFAPPTNETDPNNLVTSNVRGTISTAQTSNINSFSGQWFFNTIDNIVGSPINNLDSVPHTAFGAVIGTGMTIVDQINNTPVFNVSNQLSGPAAGALTQVPLRNFTQGNVPDSSNFIQINSVTEILRPPGTENTFRIFENSAAATVVGQVSATGGNPGAMVYDINDTGLPNDLQLNADEHFEGNPAAPVVLVEYLSLQCPSCAAAEPALEQLLVDNPDDLLVVRRHLPLDVGNGGGFQHSFQAALAAEAAGRQNMFDEMVDELFNRQADWDNSKSAQEAQAVFEDIATNTLGLNLQQFNSDMNDSALTDRINRDIATAGNLNAVATPSFFLNSQLTSSVPTNSQIQTAAQAVDRTFALNRQTGELSVVDQTDLDFETNPTFTLDVRVTNGTTEILPVTVNLIDIFFE